MKRTKFMGVLIAALPLALTAWGDTLLLRNGNSFTGTFVRGTDRDITFNLDNGRTRTFRVDDVRTIEFGSGYSGYGSANREVDNGRYFPDTRSSSNTNYSGVGGRRAFEVIDSKYREMGGANGALGAPISAMQPAADGRGQYRDFQNGSIYWSPRTGAHVVVGGIREHWMNLGGPQSELGYPVSDELNARDGVSHYQAFERGTLVWHPNMGVRVESRNYR